MAYTDCHLEELSDCIGEGIEGSIGADEGYVGSTIEGILVETEETGHFLDVKAFVGVCPRHVVTGNVTRCT